MRIKEFITKKDEAILKFSEDVTKAVDGLGEEWKNKIIRLATSSYRAGIEKGALIFEETQPPQ